MPDEKIRVCVIFLAKYESQLHNESLEDFLKNVSFGVRPQTFWCQNFKPIASA